MADSGNEVGRMTFQSKLNFVKDQPIEKSGRFRIVGS